MIYCSLDIETTGLNHESCDILQFAAVLDNLSNPQPIENLPRFEAFFLKDEPIVGEPYALSMHAGIFQKIAEAQKFNLDKCPKSGAFFMKIADLPKALENFFEKNGVQPSANGKFYITPAGKNIGSFDMPFLRSKIKKWGRIGFLQRVLDPALLYLNLKKDSQMPDMQLCMIRAGLSGEVAHTALEDALTVVKLLRHKLLKKKDK